MNEESSSINVSILVSSRKREFGSVRAMSSTWEMVENEQAIRIQDQNIPTWFVALIVLVTFAGTMLAAWLSSLALEQKLFFTVLGTLSAVSLISIFHLLGRSSNEETDFYVDKQKRSLVLRDGIVLTAGEILLFSTYLTRRSGYPLTLVTVTFCHNREVLEHCLVALSGGLGRNKRLGQSLASFFCTEHETTDVRNDIAHEANHTEIL